MIYNKLEENSLQMRTIDLFKKEMIQDVIDNYQLHCKCLLIMDNISSKLISNYIKLSEVINCGIFSIESIYTKRKPYKAFGAIYLISSIDLKLLIRAFLLAGPIPGMSSRELFTWDLLRRDLWYSIANLWASSCILVIR